jgi:hypothetical protein
MFILLAHADNFSTGVARHFNTSLLKYLFKFMSQLIMSLEIGGMYHLSAERTLDIQQRSLPSMLVINVASYGRYLHDFSTNMARWIDIMDLMLVASQKMLEYHIMANFTFNLVHFNQDSFCGQLDWWIFLRYEI